MTAADKKIILEHGSDYVLRMKIMADDGINNRNMANWEWMFEVYDKTGAKVNAYKATGVFTDNEDTVNGDVQILIDSTHIDTMATGVTGTDAFATEYNYYYTITVTEPHTVGAVTTTYRSIRLLRGKLAVRL